MSTTTLTITATDLGWKLSAAPPTFQCEPSDIGNGQADDATSDATLAMAPAPALVPVTYYPLATQKHFSSLRRRIQSKPYAKHLHDQLHLTTDALPALASPIAPELALPIDRACELLQPGHHAIENGWCCLPDGGAYVASKTHFPVDECGRVPTGEMIDWWFWWHSAEPERYGLWYPYNHVDARPEHSKETLARTDLSHREKWLGTTHTVTEFIGPRCITVRIQFVSPDYFGLAEGDLCKAGYETAVCAILWDAKLPLKVGSIIHLWRKAEDGGLELRSRYWIGHEVQMDLWGWKIPLGTLGGWFCGRNKKRYGESLAYEQFLHTQIEFTNLASILPALFEEFGKTQ